MKNKAWFFLFILLCGSAATVSAFANEDASAFPGGEQEISNDDAETTRQDAVEAVNSCLSDCKIAEKKGCEDSADKRTKVAQRACMNNVASFCERKCN